MTGSTPEDLTATAYQRIRSMILHQDFRPGERTSVARMAEATGLSRAPVRSAVERLATEGLLRLRGRSGTYVAKLDRPDIERLFELRALYESAAAPLITERITERQLDAIGRLVADLSPAPARDDRSPRARMLRFIDADVAFHEGIIAGADNPYLIKHYSSLNLHLLISHYLMFEGGTNAAQRHREHLYITEALKERDAVALAAALVRHTEAVREAILSTMDELARRAAAPQ